MNGSGAGQYARKSGFRLKGLIAGMVLTLSACSLSPYQPDGQIDGLDGAEILNSPLRDERTLASMADVDLLGRSLEMQSFLADNINRTAGPRSRLEQLVSAVVKGHQFQLDYNGSTRTAAETFSEHSGNCLSFTSMFIALARGVGLKARFQEVDIAPDWSMSGQTFLISQHVNAVVELRNDMNRVIDFNVYDFNADTDGRLISDERALAHYYNNVGVDSMLGGDTALAYANFSRSLEADQRFASAWVNMGILHRRSGLPKYAEAAYREALEVDSANLQAMSNLADLYTEQGRLEAADYYLERVHAHRMHNPYYRYQLAVEALQAGDYEGSIDHLRYAIRKRKEDHRFYYMMSLNYWMTGDREAAARWLTRAEEAASVDANKAQYRRKLEWLSKREAQARAYDSSPNTLPTGPE